MSKNGYTLIELLIVFALTGILFTIGYISFLDYSRQQNLISFVRTVQSDLKTTQESAIAGNKPSGCDTYLNGYQFLVDSTTSYTISANCTPSTNIIIKQVNAPSGYTLTAPNPNPIIFKSLASGTNISGSGTASIVIKQTITGNTRTITVGANGDVK